MRVAWIANVLTGGESFYLPGEHAGGGEMADAGMIALRPDGVEVTMVNPAEWQHALDYDRIVITGTEQLTYEAMFALAQRKPIVWLHSLSIERYGLKELITKADPFLTMSELHAKHEFGWSGVRSMWNHGWIDPDDVTPAVTKSEHALWAARNHPQKGLMGARIWAQNHGVPLVEITDAPRREVLDAMSVARYFVLLPKGFDTCPRTLIEAELAGCEIVTNQWAGRRDPGDIREVLLAQPGKFWSLL